jgi:transposase
LQTTCLPASPVGPTPHDGKRGRPGPGAQPAQSVSSLVGARASRLTDRRARIDQQSGVLLATNALAEGQVSSQAVLDGYTGQAWAERGFRFRKAPQFVAASLSLKKPERVMALWMVLTLCVLVSAA